MSSLRARTNNPFSNSSISIASSPSMAATSTQYEPATYITPLYRTQHTMSSNQQYPQCQIPTAIPFTHLLHPSTSSNMRVSEYSGTSCCSTKGSTVSKEFSNSPLDHGQFRFSAMSQSNQQPAPAPPAMASSCSFTCGSYSDFQRINKTACSGPTLQNLQGYENHSGADYGEKLRGRLQDSRYEAGKPRGEEARRLYWKESASVCYSERRQEHVEEIDQGLTRSQMMRADHHGRPVCQLAELGCTADQLNDASSNYSNIHHKRPYNGRNDEPINANYRHTASALVLNSSTINPRLNPVAKTRCSSFADNICPPGSPPTIEALPLLNSLTPSVAAEDDIDGRSRQGADYLYMQPDAYNKAGANDADTELTLDLQIGLPAASSARHIMCEAAADAPAASILLAGKQQVQARENQDLCRQAVEDAAAHIFSKQEQEDEYSKNSSPATSNTSSYSVMDAEVISPVSSFKAPTNTSNLPASSVLREGQYWIPTAAQILIGPTQFACHLCGKTFNRYNNMQDAEHAWWNTLDQSYNFKGWCPNGPRKSKENSSLHPIFCTSLVPSMDIGTSTLLLL